MRHHFHRPPVIITGMHRSGTSMIAGFLQSLGLFLGERQDQNHEASFFSQLNDWLLRQSGGAWDHPAPLRHLLQCREERALTLDYLRHLLRSPRASAYHGWRGYLSGLAGWRSDRPWGWKDPRSTVTLPIWLELFPDAKVIEIRRHGIDVAHSLRSRRDHLLAEYRSVYRSRKPFFWLYPKRGGFTDTLRCARLEGGFTLWEEYLEAAELNLAQLGERCLRLRYEDFLAEPEQALVALDDFCGLGGDRHRIRALCGRIKKGRACAYRGSDELLSFADRVKGRLERHGY